MTKKTSDEEFRELSSAIADAVPRDLDANVAHYWVVNKDKLAKDLSHWLSSNVGKRRAPSWGIMMAGYRSGPSTDGIFPITVDYDRTFEEMFKAVGDYLINMAICKEHLQQMRYWTSETSTVNGDGPYRTPGAIRNEEVKLVMRTLKDLPSIGEAPRRLESMGLRAARLEEFLALCERYPEMQDLGSRLIICGSVCTNETNRRFVPCLDEKKHIPFSSRTNEDKDRRWMSLSSIEEDLSGQDTWFGIHPLFLAAMKE